MAACTYNQLIKEIAETNGRRIQPRKENTVQTWGKKSKERNLLLMC